MSARPEPAPLPCEPQWAERIEDALDGAADAAAWSQLAAHLEACPACGRAYTEAGRLAALLAGGGPDDLPPAAVDRGEARLLAALGLTEAEPASSAAPASPLPPRPVEPAASAGARVLAFPPRPRGRAAPWLGGLALATAALALWLARPSPEPAGVSPLADGLQARSGQGSAGPGLRVFCIDVAPPTPAVRASAVADGPAVRCQVGDRLQFTWSAPQAGAFYLSLWAVGHDGAVRRLWDAAESGPLTGGAVDQVVRRTWPLEQAGALTLYGVFGERPAPPQLTAAALAEAATRGQGEGGRVVAARLEVEAR